MKNQTEIKVLDHGYVKFIESWGNGEASEKEAAIIEAARQSTQGNFRGWEVWHCGTCECSFSEKSVHRNNLDEICEAVWSNDEKLLAFMFNNKHSTPFEFCGMTIEVQAPIFVFREWHRHRTQSYNEMSARYTPLPDISYLPTVDRLFLTQDKNKQAQGLAGTELFDDNAKLWLSLVESFYQHAEELYQNGLEFGVPKEIARIVLPVGRYSRMRATANLRNWLAFLTLRIAPDAQFEIRQFANAVGEIIEREFPKTWELFQSKNGK